MTQRKRSSRGPLIVAHRGSSGRAPENTITSFRCAVQDQADMIELDVRMSADHELVVMHDQTLRRTTNGSGYVRLKTLDTLQEIDAGSWFAPRFHGERIPTLRAVIADLPSHLPFNIEVKTDGDRRRNALVLEALQQLIADLHLSSRVVVSSFDHRFLRRLHRAAPDLTIGVLLLPVGGSVRRPETYARRLSAQWIVCAKRQVRKRLVEQAHDAGLSVACYTVNSVVEYDHVCRFGVDAVVTNYPALLVEHRRTQG
jgi:glycerophosphoryl diester phosphodiesterase